ncbi:MAG: hypothetical protein JJ992_11875 [Planctomycetes bacterium]|nr:hypothetical protein [Planctomycetota bacterium]
MRASHSTFRRIAAILALILLTSSGCGSWKQFRRQPEAPLGTISDDIWQRQEHNAEASDFVIYQHEFKLDEIRLNRAGEDHVKEIADRLLDGQDFPVVVERSMTTPREDSEYKYPVNPNPELDMTRCEVVVRALVALGVNDADERVVVAPRLCDRLQGDRGRQELPPRFAGHR